MEKDMKPKVIALTLILVLISSLCLSPTLLSESVAVQNETVTPAFQYAIANVPGKTVTAMIVDYKPGAKSLPHRHGSAFVVAYVLSGSIRSKVNNGEDKIYHAGESWTEAPGDHHVMGENASETEPAKLLATFIADSKEKNLVTFDKK